MLHSKRSRSHRMKLLKDGFSMEPLRWPLRKETRIRRQYGWLRGCPSRPQSSIRPLQTATDLQILHLAMPMEPLSVENDLVRVPSYVPSHLLQTFPSLLAKPYPTRSF